MQSELEQKEQLKNSLIRNATRTKGNEVVNKSHDVYIREAEANDLEDDENSSAN